MQKGTAALFLLIVGCIIFAAIAAFYFSGLVKPLVLPVSFRTLIPPSNEQVLSSGNEQVLSSGNETLLPTSDPKFLIFSSKNLGLEFQYPIKGYKTLEDSEEEFNKRGNGNFRKNFTGYVGYEPGKFLAAVVLLDTTNSYESNPLTVWVFDNPDSLTLDDWFGKYWYYPFLWGVFDKTSKGHVTPDTEVTISGKLSKAKVVSYQPGEPKYVYAYQDKRMYLFRVVGNEGENILSSVKLFAENGNEQNCKVSGCSGQLCIEEGQDDVSTCEFREDYACYKGVKCEKQADGKCGWIQTDELTKCLQEKK
ncbi:hypothetical protein HYT74_03995 [Candidatus Daviesbacteria bacterium]|nr:hypothetical protein [Candidatus Daviesbacteria bacterium]MBI4038818.1 hypothetical protein [Candidatus Daviesbacteria bacterium]